VQKPPLDQADIHEGGLEGAADVGDLPFVYVPDERRLAGALDEIVFEPVHPVAVLFQDGDADLAPLPGVNEYQRLHGLSSRNVS